MTTPDAAPEVGRVEALNPFVVESPEKLQPQDIARLFVEAYTRIETIKQRKHTFIWGSRGSGKSMMLRYLEPKCQAIVHHGTAEFFRSKPPFLALYCPCKEGYFNKTEMNMLEPLTARILTEHMLNLYVAAKLADCLHSQFDSGFFDDASKKRFARTVLSLFDRASIASSVEEVNEYVSLEENSLVWLLKLFGVENKKINAYLRNNVLRKGELSYEGATSGYHDFLLPLMQAVRELPHMEGIPVYVMIDDANRLTRDQQTVVNTWISNRDQEHVCFKVAAEFSGYQTFRNNRELFSTLKPSDLDLAIEGGGWIEAPHDYSGVDVDELYTNSQSDYIAKVKGIANRRLEVANLPVKDIEQFLPPDAEEEARLEQIKKDTAEEWEQRGRPGRQKDYVYRYATARLFQWLRDKKKKSYAGFTNMVHLSSGVLRGFLEPCYLMYDEYVSGRESRHVESIPPDVQNKVLFRYSEEFILADIDKIRKELPPEAKSSLEALSTLLNSLGRLFYERLHDPDAREARLFSFTVRGQIPEDIQEVLRLGVRYRYFQLRTYSTKEGGGREKWYVLNRRLCPVFQLDPTGFEGRISLTPDHLKIACTNAEKFVRLRLKQSPESSQLDLFSLTEEE